VSSIPPVDDGQPVEVRETIVRDRTPEREEVQRTITPVQGGRFGGSNKIGGIVAVAGVLAALFFINVGGKSDKPASTMSMVEDAKLHPERRAEQTAQYDTTNAPPPNLAGTTAPTATRMMTMPDGTVVPAIEPAAGQPTGQPVATGTPAGPTGESLAVRARRAPMLVNVGGADNGSAAGDADGSGGAASGPADASGTPGRAAAPAGELDKLRQVSAIGSSRASVLPNRDYLVTAGTLIPCILQTAMNSTQPGYTSCIIPRDVFSDNGKVVLMEKGTKVLGQYQGGMQQGQNRLFVLWTRAVTPHGVAIDLASPASDALGRAGMAGAVDTFFWARFGSAILLSLIDAGANIASTEVSKNGSFNVSQPSNAAGIALQNNINIRPVLKKNQGEEVGIYVAQDFNFADVYGLEPRK
jgi:type IV secretion system protein VirB10